MGWRESYWRHRLIEQPKPRYVTPAGYIATAIILGFATGWFGWYGLGTIATIVAVWHIWFRWRNGYWEL